MNFLEELGHQLMLPELKRRAHSTHLPYAVRESAAEIAEIKISAVRPTDIAPRISVPPKEGSFTRSESNKKNQK